MKFHSVLCFLVSVAVTPLPAQTTQPAPATPGGFAHADAVRRVEYASSGKWLVSMDDMTIKTWRMPDGTRTGSIVLPGRIETFRCSPTEPLLAILTNNYDIELRTIPDLALVRSWPSLDYTAGIAFSPKGDILATCASSGGIRFWDTSTGAQVKRIELDEGFKDLVFSPDGKWLVSAGSTGRWDGRPKLNVWQLSDYKRVQEAVTPYRDGTFFTMAFTPDSAYLAAGSNNDQISLWQMPGGKPAVIKDGHPYALWTVCAGVDGKTMLSADNGRVRLWNLPDCSVRATYEAHGKQINSIAASPDGVTFVTASADRTIRLWKLVDGSPVLSLVEPAAATKPAPMAEATNSGPATETRAEKTGAEAATAPSLVVSGRLVGGNGQPVSNFTLKLPLVFPGEQAGLLYMFAPHFFEATTDADGRFKFTGVISGKKYALVHVAGTNLSPLKRLDGSIVVLDIGPGAANIDLGEIPFERR